jgi:hypothetical protein
MWGEWNELVALTCGVHRSRYKYGECELTATRISSHKDTANYTKLEAYGLNAEHVLGILTSGDISMPSIQQVRGGLRFASTQLPVSANCGGVETNGTMRFDRRKPVGRSVR